MRFLAWLAALLVSTGSLAAPVVSGVSGVVSNGNAVTISGSGFGANGPTIVVFDDFEKGANGAAIPTTSPQVGTYDAVNAGPTYSTTRSKSGTRAMVINQINGSLVDNNSITTAWAPNGNFLVSFWAYIPAGQNVGGTAQGLPNWKFFWVGDRRTGWQPGYGDDYVDVLLSNTFDYGIFQVADAPINGRASCGSHMGNGANTATGKGKWFRLTYWMKEATGTGGGWWSQEMDGSTVKVPCSASGVTTGSSGVAWTWLQMPGYIRSGDAGSVWFDDFYVATGSGARARVEICNNATYANATNCAISTPSAWNDTQITATIRPGSFTSGSAWLFIIDANGTASSGFAVTIGSGGGTTPPTANFTCTPLSGQATLAVTCTDSSTNAPTSWSWDCGNGSTPTTQNASCSYPTPGTYTVSLTATNAGGSNTLTRTNYITVTTPPPPAPVASFTCSAAGDTPLTVTCNDTSTNTPTSWIWTCGDGSAAKTTQNISCSYTYGGNYTVSLRATNATGNDTTTKNIAARLRKPSNVRMH